MRFRKDMRIILESGGAVRPDIVFTSRKLAVFIDGCFWHRCPIHDRMPKANRSYWAPKLKGNVERDRRSDAELRANGWRVARFFEHVPITAAADQIEELWRAY